MHMEILQLLQPLGPMATELIPILTLFHVDIKRINHLPVG